MDTHRDAREQSVFVKVGWYLGHSHAGRLFLSIGVAALFCGAAYAAWYDRESAAWVLAVCLVVYGLELAWSLLPISEATRIRWSHDRQVAQRCPASKYRLMLWIGIAMAISAWLWPGVSKSHDYFAFIVPGLFVAWGVVSHILCYQFVRNERRM